MSYQNVFRDLRNVYREKGISGYEYAILYHLQLSANPKTGIYFTHARRISEEIGIEVETVRSAQQKLKRAGFLLYKDSHHYRTRPYMLPGFILFKTSKEITITRSIPDMLTQCKKTGIIPQDSTKTTLSHFLHDCGENWTRFHSCFAKKITPDFSIFDYFMYESKTPLPEIIKLPAGNPKSEKKHIDESENEKSREEAFKNIKKVVG